MGPDSKAIPTPNLKPETVLKMTITAKKVIQTPTKVSQAKKVMRTLHKTELMARPTLKTIRTKLEQERERNRRPMMLVLNRQTAGKGPAKNRNNKERPTTPRIRQIREAIQAKIRRKTPGATAPILASRVTQMPMAKGTTICNPGRHR